MRRFRPSPALVVALLALVFGLAGTGIAARSYVVSSSRQIKDGAVTGADVKNSSLTGADVRNRSLTASDFSGSLQGPAGPQGAQGPKGDTGQPGPTASAYAWYEPLAPIDLTSPDASTKVMDLDSGTHSSRLTVGYDARVIAAATFDVVATQAGVQQVSCTLTVKGPGVNRGRTFWSYPAGTGTALALPVTVGVDVGPGTFNVVGECWAFGGSHATFERGSITAVATAR